MKMSESVVLNAELKSPIDRVWRAITDSATLSEWMMFKTNNFKPEVGHAFQFRDAPGYDGVIDCEVTEVDEPNTLAYTWSTMGEGDVPHTTVVTINLSEANGVTQLHLEQSGFRPDAKQETAGARYGWQMMLDQLQGVLAG
jgi:uncharacterized protein YndB with AHSA1/START domain